MPKGGVKIRMLESDFRKAGLGIRKECLKHFSSARIFSSLSSHPPPQDLVLISSLT